MTTTWTQNPRLAALHARAAYLANEATGDSALAAAARRAQNAGTYPQDGELRRIYDEVQEREAESSAEFQDAAQEALDAILPELSENEELVYTTMLNLLDDTNVLGRGKLNAGQRWSILARYGNCVAMDTTEWHSIRMAGERDGENADDLWEEVAHVSGTHIVRPVAPVLHEPDEFYPAGGNNIRALRERSGLTITELARRSGLSRTQLSKLENGAQEIRNSSFETAMNLASALGVKMEDLLK